MLDDTTMNFSQKQAMISTGPAGEESEELSIYH